MQFEQQGFGAELIDVVHSGICDYVLQFVDFSGDIEAREDFVRQTSRARNLSILAFKVINNDHLIMTLDSSKALTSAFNYLNQANFRRFGSEPDGARRMCSSDS